MARKSKQSYWGKKFVSVATQTVTKSDPVSRESKLQNMMKSLTDFIMKELKDLSEKVTFLKPFTTKEKRIFEKKIFISFDASPRSARHCKIETTLSCKKFILLSEKMI